MQIAAIIRTIAIGVAVISIHAGCEKRSSTGDPRDPVVQFADEDAEMNAAIKTAKSTIDQFVAALQRPADNQSYFSVKKPFPTSDGGGEHIWLDDLSFDGTTFVGTVGNIPAAVPGLKQGDRASVGTTEISDWMIVHDDGKLTGGFTLRVIRDRMTPAEREAFDRDTGLVIE